MSHAQLNMMSFFFDPFTSNLIFLAISPANDLLTDFLRFTLAGLDSSSFLYGVLVKSDACEQRDVTFSVFVYQSS